MPIIIVLGPAGGGGGLLFILFLIFAVIFADLMMLFGLPLMAYFMFLKGNPQIYYGIGASVPMFAASLVAWILNIMLFCKLVLKKNILKNLVNPAMFVNECARILICIAAVGFLIYKALLPEAELASEMIIGAIFAYNLIFSLVEVAIYVKHDYIPKKAFLSFPIALLIGGIVTAVAIEIQSLRNLSFEIMVILMLAILEVCLCVFKWRAKNNA